MKTNCLKIKKAGLIIISTIVAFCCQITAASASPQVETDKNRYKIGETITVKFFDSSGDSRDWICIVPINSPETEAGDYQNIPSGLTEGTLTFNSPPAGNYEVRAYYNYRRNGYVVSARYQFSVGDGVSSNKSGSSQTIKPTKSVSTDKAATPGKSKQSSPAEGDQKAGEEKSEGGVWSGVMKGHGRATDIGDNQYAIEVTAGIGFGGAGAMYKVWDKEARKACKGSYKVIERQVIHDSSGVGKSDRLVGSVECK